MEKKDEERLRALEALVRELQIKTMSKRILLLCYKAGVSSARVAVAPPDYYDRTLEERMQIIKAPSINHLTKTLIVENHTGSVEDCSDPDNSKYYAVIVQYVAKFNSEKMMKIIRDRCKAAYTKKGLPTIGKQFFRYRLVEADVSYELSGYSHNAIVPIGMRVNIPIIMSHHIAALQPNFFWMGGGDVDLKLGMNVQSFIEKFNVLVEDITGDD